MRTPVYLAFAMILAAGSAFAHETGNVRTAPTTSVPSSASTAPMTTAPSRAPTAPTTSAQPSGGGGDQGFALGPSAVPIAPHPSTPHPHGPDSPQSGVPGTQDPSQLGGR